MWEYTIIKNIDAPFAWIYRINQPLFTSRVMYSMLLKAKSILGV